MTARERTLQQLHPLGALASRPITVVAAIGVPIFATVMTALNREDITSAPIGIFALAALCVASAALYRASSPARAPFTQDAFLLVFSAGIVAMIANAASMFGSNQFVRDDWGPTSIGLLVIAIAPYRPAKEIATAGSLAAILAGVIAIVEMPYVVTPVPTIVIVVVQCTPILAMSLAGAAFSNTLVRGLERWRRRASTAVVAMRDSRNDWIARSVQQNHVTILNRDVVPFFAAIVRDGEITSAQSEHARVLSDTIRSVMVADADRSWLDGIVQQSAASAGLTDELANDVVTDEQHIAAHMATEQRTALRAAMVALFAHPSFDPGSLRLVLAQEDGRGVVRVVANVDCTRQKLRSELAPYFAIMRILFTDHEVHFLQPELRLRFSYDL